jgi:hypothetical protein
VMTFQEIYRIASLLPVVCVILYALFYQSKISLPKLQEIKGEK